MNKYTKFIKSKIGLIMLGLTILFPATVSADTPIQYTTNVSNVLLEHGETYQFVCTNDANANNTGVATIDGIEVSSEQGSLIVSTSSSSKYTKHTHKGCPSHQVANGEATVCKVCGGNALGYDPDKGVFCGTCSKYGQGTKKVTTYKTVYDCGNLPLNSTPVATYNSEGVLTLTANYFDMDGSVLQISMGGQSYSWNININLPAPRISSNLTTVNCC